MEYLTILVAIFATFLILKIKFRIQLFKSLREKILFFVACLAIGVAWDSFAIVRGHWTFGEQYFIGIKVGVMPIEEYLFMLIIPFSVLVLYNIVTKR